MVSIISFVWNNLLIQNAYFQTSQNQNLNTIEKFEEIFGPYHIRILADILYINYMLIA